MMFKKITAVMFALALVVFTFLPGNEARIDVLNTSIRDDAQADTLTRSVGSYSYGADGQMMSMDRNYDEGGPQPTPAPSLKPTNAPTPTPLVSGVSNADVINMQSKLIELGFLDGTADGIYGAATITAVQDAKKFLNEQYQKDLPVAFADEGGTTSSGLPFNTTGDGDYKFLQSLYNTDFTQYMTAMQQGDTGAAVKRLQTRLMQLGYIYKGADGAYGATTATAISNFQARSDLPQSGIADVNTQRVLFSSAAKDYGRPIWDYSVKVDLSEQRVYVYQWEGKTGDYTDLVKKFKCSTGASGTPTPRGTYKETVRRGAQWHHFKEFGNCWARYAIHIDPTGNIMFHSVLYTRKGGSPTSSSVRAIGRPASHGCIRLPVNDAKWLYENIRDGTTVVIQK